MPPSKFEANPTLCRRVKHTSFSLFPLASLCSNMCFCAYAIIDFLADQLVFLNTITYVSEYGKRDLMAQNHIFSESKSTDQFCG